MYDYNKGTLTEFTYLIERISMVTKQFLNTLKEDDKIYCIMKEIYKSTQNINYEFIKLYYNVKADKDINFNLLEDKRIELPTTKIKNLNDYISFLNTCNNNFKNSMDLICNSTEKYSSSFITEINKFNELKKQLTSN